jgi:hypothetical protein
MLRIQLWNGGTTGEQFLPHDDNNDRKSKRSSMILQLQPFLRMTTRTAAGKKKFYETQRTRGRLEEDRGDDSDMVGSASSRF